MIFLGLYPLVAIVGIVVALVKIRTNIDYARRTIAFVDLYTVVKIVAVLAFVFIGSGPFALVLLLSWQMLTLAAVIAILYLPIVLIKRSIRRHQRSSGITSVPLRKGRLTVVVACSIVALEVIATVFVVYFMPQLMERRNFLRESTDAPLLTAGVPYTVAGLGRSNNFRLPNGAVVGVENRSAGGNCYANVRIANSDFPTQLLSGNMEPVDGYRFEDGNSCLWLLSCNQPQPSATFLVGTCKPVPTAVDEKIIESCRSETDPSTCYQEKVQPSSVLGH